MATHRLRRPARPADRDARGPGRRASPTRHAALLALAGLATLVGLLAGACGDGREDPERSNAAEDARRHAVPEPLWREMLDSEELVVALGPRLRAITRSLRNLRLPDDAARAVFDVVVDATDLEPAAPEPTRRALQGLPVSVHRLESGPSLRPTSPHGLDLWRALLDRVAYFEWAKLAVLRGRFRDGARTHFDTELKLEGRARLASGSIVSVAGRLEVGWKRRPGANAGDAASWRITSWRSGPLTLQETGRSLFREVLDAVLADEDALRRARHSEHEALVLRYLRDPEGFEPPSEHFSVPSHDRHPGIAVADVDGNGWDDLYVMPRWGRNLLFLNRGDGRFEERAEALGLAIENHCSSAIFADFDNDGDLDAFVGRTLAPSVYLENHDGHFRPRPDALPPGELPMLVASLAASDLDGDGLLDLYVSTYAAHLVVRQVKGRTRIAREGGPAFDRVLEAFLSEGDARRLYDLSLSSAAHEYLSLPGPPNLLLSNRGGGRFEASPSDHALRVFANTYQASFSDFDRDGDPDVYLAHDFSPNQLFRNDGDAGFRDVTAETGTADIGFGMGVSWGDYDRDGLEDLYVTNMYSKAGNRITGFFDQMNPSFRKMARGNSLFRSTGAAGGWRFESRAGEAEGELPVEIAGWSWGGQFADLNNDGFLDLYALSGYYTAPPEVEALVDI